MNDYYDNFEALSTRVWCGYELTTDDRILLYQILSHVNAGGDETSQAGKAIILDLCVERLHEHLGPREDARSHGE